ncbi:hypothetical protein [Devosia salina]|uniref:Uncharacterized protein n=1 Tax=Devosia salina TaxID=2860336 RepID=A0ABX8WFF2_9HYPH|nr:hypothetical protein [Devosia salina]QYO76726.1 hypothetical protein K1X15_19470 [Devosia salina]
MRIAIGLALWGALTSFSLAQDGPERVLALYCYGGDGCQGFVTPFTYPEMDRLLNKLGTLEGEGFGKPVVFLRNNAGEAVDYVDMQRTPEEINILFGGRGEPPIISSFPDLGDIQPRDGKWSVTIGSGSAENCPPGVEGAMSGLRLAESGDIAFATPFDPGQALPDQSVNWLKIGPGHYRAVLPGSDAMFATYDLIVEAPERLSGTIRAVATAPGPTPCTITLPVAYQHAES